MNGYRKKNRKMLAMLMCIVLVFCHFSVTSLAEEGIATPTDLAGEPEPFERTETVDGVKITVTVKEGADIPDGEAVVTKVNNEVFAIAAETSLGLAQNSSTVIRHMIYSISIRDMRGTGKVKLEKLGLTGLQEQYPDGTISVHVLQYNESAQNLRDKAQVIPAFIKTEQNTVTFSLADPGLYDVVTAVQLPEETAAAEEANSGETADGIPAEEPEESAEAPAEQAAAEPEPEQTAEEGQVQELPAEQQETEEPVKEESGHEDTVHETEKHEPAPEPAVSEETEPETIHKALTEETAPAQADVLSGTAQEEDVILLQAAAEETDKVKAFVIRCYWLILGREQDQKGLEDWANKLKSKSATAADIIFGFLGSKEFVQKHKSSEELIEILYRTMLNRSSDETGRNGWSRLIASGASLNKLINGFCESVEFKRICENYGIEAGTLPDSEAAVPVAYSERLTAFATRCYREALNRDPDEGGLQFWCNHLTRKTKTFSEVAAGFVFSDEMNKKQLNDEAFIKVLYRLYLGREAEEAGLNYWKNQLKEGMTREQANEGFANSREFAGIVAGYDSEAGAEPEYSYILVPDDTGIIINNGAKVQIQVSPQLAKTGTALKWLSSDTKIFTVSQEGELTGCYPGQARLKVYLPDGQLVTETTVTVKANYRAVMFSESTFAGGVIRRNRGDVRLMKNMLSSVRGQDGETYKAYSFDDLTAKEVYAKIDQLLVAPSRDGDVSMFFFASHGDYKSTSQKLAGRLWCKNKETWLELPELAKKLSNAKGKVIVILESCGPGAAVKEWDNENLSTATSEGETTVEEEADAPDLSEMFISAFAAADPGLTVYETNEYTLSGAGENTGGGQTAQANQFLTEKFVVLTASAYLQTSYMVGEHTYNLFPYWLTKGVGTSGAMPADIEHGNGDGKLTVNELYQYVYKHTSYRQTPQVYPKNSDYVLFLRK